MENNFSWKKGSLVGKFNGLVVISAHLVVKIGVIVVKGKISKKT
ncbi:hypothetical protein [Psychrobacillus sp. NEAU-3TGS]|nr:hypothetical protein [Psychrobacillus sp. NEAU-3TGS]